MEDVLSNSTGQKHLDFWTTCLKLLTGKSEIFGGNCISQDKTSTAIHLDDETSTIFEVWTFERSHNNVGFYVPRHSPVSGEHIRRHRLVSSTVGSGATPTIKIDGSERETATATTLNLKICVFAQETRISSSFLINGTFLWFKSFTNLFFWGFFRDPVLWTSILYHLRMLSPGLRSCCSFPDDQSDQVFSSQAHGETNGIVSQWKGIQTKHKRFYRVRELVQESSKKNLEIWVVVTLQLLVMKTLVFASDFFPSNSNFRMATFWIHIFWEPKNTYLSTTKQPPPLSQQLKN